MGLVQWLAALLTLAGLVALPVIAFGTAGE